MKVINIYFSGTIRRATSGTGIAQRKSAQEKEDEDESAKKKPYKVFNFFYVDKCKALINW